MDLTLKIADAAASAPGHVIRHVSTLRNLPNVQNFHVVSSEGHHHSHRSPQWSPTQIVAIVAMATAIARRGMAQVILSYRFTISCSVYLFMCDRYKLCVPYKAQVCAIVCEHMRANGMCYKDRHDGVERFATHVHQ